MGNPWSQLACAPELYYFIDINIGHCNFTAKEETLIPDIQQKLYFLSRLPICGAILLKWDE